MHGAPFEVFIKAGAIVRSTTGCERDRAQIRPPYRTVALLAVLGSALTGRLLAIGILIFFFAILLRRIGKEATIMRENFPNDRATCAA
jgi:protein-S-isoprenylcysteine O-methyltransferase Ste14